MQTKIKKSIKREKICFTNKNKVEIKGIIKLIAKINKTLKWKNK